MKRAAKQREISKSPYPFSSRLNFISRAPTIPPETQARRRYVSLGIIMSATNCLTKTIDQDGAAGVLKKQNGPANCLPSKLTIMLLTINEDASVCVNRLECLGCAITSRGFSHTYKKQSIIGEAMKCER